MQIGFCCHNVSYERPNSFLLQSHRSSARKSKFSRKAQKEKEKSEKELKDKEQKEKDLAHKVPALIH